MNQSISFYQDLNLDFKIKIAFKSFQIYEKAFLIYLKLQQDFGLLRATRSISQNGLLPHLTRGSPWACADAEDILMASRLESSSKSGLPITWITESATNPSLCFKTHGKIFLEKISNILQNVNVKRNKNKVLNNSNFKLHSILIDLGPSFGPVLENLGIKICFT